MKRNRQARAFAMKLAQAAVRHKQADDPRYPQPLSPELAQANYGFGPAGSLPAFARNWNRPGMDNWGLEGDPEQIARVTAQRQAMLAQHRATGSANINSVGAPAHDPSVGAALTNPPAPHNAPQAASTPTPHVPGS